MEVGVGWSSSATAARPHVSYTRAWLDIGEVWGDMGRYGELWGAMGRHGEMLGRCGETWGDVGRYGEMWGAMGRYGARLGLRGVEDVREAERAQADAWRHGEHLGRYREI